MRKDKYFKRIISVVCATALLVAGVPVEKTSAEENVFSLETVQTSRKKASVAENCMDQIFENLIKSGSTFSDMKEMYKDPTTGKYDVNFSAVLNEEKTEIAISMSVDKSSANYEDYKEMEGTWTFRLDGNYLTSQNDNAGTTGEIISIFSVFDAVVQYLNLDKELADGFYHAVTTGAVKSDDFIVDYDITAKNVTCKMNVAGSWQLEEVLGNLYLNKDILTKLDLNELAVRNGNMTANMGKLRTYTTKSDGTLNITIAEYKGRTELTYKSALAFVELLKPTGYENFLKNYKTLSTASTAYYQVTFPEKKEDIVETLQNKIGNYKFTNIRFQASSFNVGDNISLKAGKQKKLTVSTGTVKKWSSSKKAVATVKNGKVTALKKGTTVITALLSDGTTLTCTVKVTSSPTIKVAGKKFSAKKTYQIKKKKTLTIKIAGKASSVNNKYASSKKKVAKVTSKKTASTIKVKGLKKGSAKISVTVNGVKFTIKVKVK